MAALWVICAALVIAPTFAPFGSIAPFDQERMLQVGACAVALAISAGFDDARRRVTSVVSGTSPILRSLLGAAFLLGYVSSALGPHPRASFVDVTETAIVVLAVFAVAGAVRASPARAVDLIAVSLAASAAFAAAELTLRLAALETAATTLVHPPALFEHFQHPRFFGQWMTWLLPLLAVPCARARNAGSRWLEALVWISWASCWSFAFVAAGRGTFVAQGAAVLIVVAVFGRSVLRWLWSYLAAASAGAALYFAYALVLPQTWSEIAHVAARLGSVSDSGRLAIWNATLRTIARHPVLGAAPRAMSYEIDLPVAHPHNSVLQWASEWGVPACVLITAALGGALTGWLWRRRSELAQASVDPVLVVGLAAALVGAGAHSLLSGVLIMPISQLMAVVTAGCALGIDAVPRSRASSRAWWTPAVAVVLLVWIITSEPEVERVFDAGAPTNVEQLKVRPRIWHDETSVLGMHGSSHGARRALQHP